MTVSEGVVDPDLIDRNWADKMQSQVRVARNEGADLVVGDSMMRTTDMDKYQDQCEGGFGTDERLRRDLGNGWEMECLARGGVMLGRILE